MHDNSFFRQGRNFRLFNDLDAEDIVLAPRRLLSLESCSQLLRVSARPGPDGTYFSVWQPGKGQQYSSQEVWG